MLFFDADTLLQYELSEYKLSELLADDEEICELDDWLIECNDGNPSLFFYFTLSFAEDSDDCSEFSSCSSSCSFMAGSWSNMLFLIFTLLFIESSSMSDGLDYVLLLFVIIF